MEFNRSQDYKKEDGLNDLITFFAGTVAHLPEVKLDKLIYIAHLYHYANFGELLTKTRFFSLAYGPHAPIIRSASKRLIENKFIYLVESRTSSDSVYSNPCLIIKVCGLKDTNLSSPCLNTLREVMEHWGDRPYEHILDYTARTIPYLSTSYREPIDWTLSRPHRELKYALSYPKRVCTHSFVEEPETPVNQSNACSQGGPVSVNEVAEIYLAICGGHPDKIPSQEYLGFDLQSVLHALDEPGDKGEGGSKKCPTEIEKAAQLTHSLLNSLSFKSFSARVALKTGMFFLRRLGYSFDGDILEEHWPDGNSYEIFKEWFGKVTVKIDIKQKS
jgi:hypothetical protein